MINVLLSNFALLLWAIMSAALMGFRRAGIFCVATAVMYFALSIAGLTLLGALKLLTPDAYAIYVSLGTLITFFFARRGMARSQIRHQIITWWFGLSRFKRLFILVCLALLTVWLVRLAQTPIWDYDSIAYHLPFSAKFVQERAIFEPYFTALAGPIGYYPANIELFAAGILMFHPDPSVFNAINLGVWLLLGLSSYLIMRATGVRARLAFLGTLAWLTIPVVLRQVGTFKVDLMSTLFFALSLLFLMRFWRAGERRDLFMFSLSAGLFLGARYLAVPYLLPIVIVALAGIIRYARTTGFLGLVVNLIVAASGVLLGGYSYLRNMLVTGNPMYPAEIAFAGAKFFSGLPELTTSIFGSAILPNLTDFGRTVFFIMVYINQTGFIVPLLLSLLSMLTLLLWRGRLASLVFLIGLPLYLYIYLALPNTFSDLEQNVRYSMPFLLIAFVAIAWTLKEVKRERTATGFITLSLLLSIATGIGAVVLSKEPHLILGAPQTAASRRDAFYARLEHTYNGFAPLLHAMAWLDRNAPDNTRIGYSGFHFHFPLYGPQLTRQVRYMALSQCRDCNYHDFATAKGDIFARFNEREWLQNIRAAQIEYYVIFAQWPHLPLKDREWLAENTDQFTLVFAERGARVYHVKQNF